MDMENAVLVARIMEKMIAFSEGNRRDIDHLANVWTYARTIGKLENLDEKTQLVLEVAAITHDIACPLCRRLYGNTEAKRQEKHGEEMVRPFLSGTGLDEAEIDRVAYLVGHHHTYLGIDGIDYQILVEADYIVNALEKDYSRENILSFMEKVMRTESGKRLLRSVFCL